MTSARRVVVGIVGNDVPRQVVLAAGALPHRLTGSWEGAVDPAAAQLLGAADAPAARILTELVAGRSGCDALIVCADSQAHVRLFYVVRSILPELPLHLVDLPRAESAAARRFARVQFDDLAAFLGGLTGRAPDASTLADAGREERELGHAIQRLRDRRRAVPSQCHGAVALEALIASARLSPSEAIARIDAARSDVVASALRVHVTGSSHPDAALYRVLEEHGCVVVSEDHDTGDGAWLGAAVDAADRDGMLDALVDLHFDRVGASPTAFSAARAQLTRDATVTAEAQAVIALIRELDEAPAWDLADQERLLAEIGVPILARTRVRPGDESETARELATQASSRAVSA